MKKKIKKKTVAKKKTVKKQDAFKIVLSPKQKEYLPALEWLFLGAGNRGEGRTFLMAYVFIQKALNNPGKEIKVFDHTQDGFRNDREMLWTIEFLLSKTHTTGFYANPMHLTIKYL